MRLSGEHLRIFVDLDDILLLHAYRKRQERAPHMRTGQPGQEYMNELLDSAHPERVRQVLWMELATFYTIAEP
jgi:hypothetical protein